MKNNYKAIELFAGIGGFRIACENLGIETVWANDMESNAVKVYRDNFGEDSIVQGDINTLFDKIPEHDILTGGFPCQPFSRAGKKKGIDDYRGTLFETIIKIVNEKKPSFFVLENVNSILFMQNGRHFRTILSALSDLGYKIEWRVFNAMEFGVPQHRERVIIIGSRDGDCYDTYLLSNDVEKISKYDTDIISRYDCWSDIVKSNGKFKNWGMAQRGKFVMTQVNEDPVQNITIENILQNPCDVSEQYYSTEDTLKRIEKSVYVDKFYNGVHILYNQNGGARMGYTIFGTDGVSPTLTASTSRHYERYKIGDKYRRLTNIEYARLQGFPDNHCKAVSVNRQYKLYGNAVPHQIVEYVLSRIINDKHDKIQSNVISLFD